MRDVMLVVRMNTDDGEQDVLVKYLRGGAPHTEPAYGSNLPWHTRYIAGEEIQIAWPEDEIEDYQQEDADTNRINSEQITFIPSYLEAPLPKGVEDELAPKYSRRRPTHTQDYIRQKIVEDARSKWYEQRKLISPAQEAIEQKMARKKVHGVPELEVWDVVEKEMASVH
jgi:large subunit ribosomal protein L24